MTRIDHRILILGFIVVCALLVHPTNRAHDEPEATGSIPAVEDTVRD